MKKHDFMHNHSKKSIWFLALFAVVSVVWLIVRTGTKPSRISYPCQKAAVANINIFLVALGLPFLGLTGKLLSKRILRSRVTAAVMVTGLLAIMAVSNIGVFSINFTPAVNLAPIALDLKSQVSAASSSSNLFIIQNASGPQGNMDAAVSALSSSMQSYGLNFFNTSVNPSGLFGANDVIILKVNGQSPQRGSTNTDLARSLVKTIVGHPDGFTGEVVIADNGQDTGGVDMTENNAYYHSQSMTDVAAMFPTYKVSAYSWYTIASKGVLEYSSGNYQDGYVVNSTSNAVTGVKVSYPKFQTAYDTYISFKNGVWNQSTETYDSSRLKVINLPVFKSHYVYGATCCVKNYMGVGSQTLTGMHDTVGNGGMGTLMVETRFPTLNILDGTWINSNPFQPGERSGSPWYEDTDCGPFTTYTAASYTDVIGASTDPVALEYWVAKHVAMPAAVQRSYTYTSSIDPNYEPITQNLVQSYHHYLAASMNEIKNSGRQTTMLESEMNVYVTTLNTPTPTLPFTDNFANLNAWTIVAGSWALVSGGVQGSGSSENLMYAGSTAWTNYQVTVNLRVVNSGEASLVVRYKGSTDFYWLGLGCWGHKYSISKAIGGVYQELASSGIASEVEVGRWYVISVVAVDKTLQLFVDGVKVLEVQDGSLSNGAIGFRNWSGTMQAKQLTVQSYTLTPTPTPSPTPTSSPTYTPTPTLAPTPTATPMPTPTITPTTMPSSTPTPTASPTLTPTPTASPTPSISPSQYPSPSPTSTTATPTTPSPIPSQTQSPSPSPLPQPTETPLYLYAAAVMAIVAITVTALGIAKRR